MKENPTPAKTLTVNLDFNPSKENPIQTVYTKQSDSLWRKITVKLTKDGSVFVKENVWDIKLRGTKPDGFAFDLLPVWQDEEKGVYTFALTKSALSVCGTIVCDIVCSALADDTYICSTEVFHINNLASAVDNNPKYSQPLFQTVEEAVYSANAAANNANSAAATAINGANAAFSAAQNAVGKSELIGCMTIKSVWKNPFTAAPLSPVEIAIPSEDNSLFYLIKYRTGISRNEAKTAMLYSGIPTILSGFTPTNTAVNRTINLADTENGKAISIGSDGSNNTGCIIYEIWGIGAKD